MPISARNQPTGTISAIKQDDMMAEVVVALDGGQELVSVITAASAERLALAVGKKVRVIIKATDVMLATDD